MYIVMVILLLAVLPAASVLAEHYYFHSPASLVFLAGKWFTFWASGVRLFISGLRQTFDPRFTAQNIFKIDNVDVFPIVREIGFANLSMGALALLSLYASQLTLPGALVGGLYYALAGIGHMLVKERNVKENIAMVSDVAIAVVLLGFVTLTVAGTGS